MGVDAMPNYSDIGGVKVAEWGPDSDVDNPTQEFTGTVEEFYFDYGRLMLVIEHPDGDTVTDIEIPVKARDSWNEFVDSLPTWTNE